jgi:signal transduction histidine kinase
MDQLASFVHEIRNPLAALSGYVEMAQRETSGSGHYYELMLEEIDRLSRLTADLLEVSRPLTLTLDWVLLDPLVEHAWFTATHGERSSGRSLSLVKRYPPEQELWADADRMQQVLTNIMKNAVEAMTHQGSQVEVSYRKQGDRACLTIRDDGPGISADVLKKLMFSRVTTKESGNGLGLMIVRRILEAHGGVVQLSSDQGTVVELVWPEPR